MANDIELFQGAAQVPAHLRGLAADVNDEITKGAGSPLAILSIRGKVFRFRYQGEETVLRDPSTQEVRTFVDMVLVGGSPALSKTYYKGKYVEGSDDAPTCMSVDGVVPDAGVPERQNPDCATCRHNVWGSRISDNGSKGKACADARRLAVAPLGDIPNEVHGGPALLRVPPASLAPLAELGKRLKAQGLPFYAVGVRIGFDAEASAPKLSFRPLRYLSDTEYAQVVAMREGEQYERIVSTPVELDREATGLGAEPTPAPQARPAPVEQPAAQPEPVKPVTTRGRPRAAAKAQDEAAKPDTVPVVEAPPATNGTANGSGYARTVAGQPVEEEPKPVAAVSDGLSDEDITAMISGFDDELEGIAG